MMSGNFIDDAVDEDDEDADDLAVDGLLLADVVGVDSVVAAGAVVLAGVAVGSGLEQAVTVISMASAQMLATIRLRALVKVFPHEVQDCRG